MDKHFLEFWGNFLLSVARGQQQLEDMTRWLQGGFAVPGLSDIFQKAYGLDHLNKNAPDYLKICQQSEQDCMDAYRTYLNFMGLIPREDYAELARSWVELKEKVEEQEFTIKNLRLLLEDKGVKYWSLTQEFQELIKRQAEVAQECLSGLMGAWQTENNAYRADILQP
jgi:hypothetical protein